jgi:hypothetical protein
MVSLKLELGHRIINEKKNQSNIHFLAYVAFISFAAFIHLT